MERTKMMTNLNVFLMVMLAFVGGFEANTVVSAVREGRAASIAPVHAVGARPAPSSQPAPVSTYELTPYPTRKLWSSMKSECDSIRVADGGAFRLPTADEMIEECGRAKEALLPEWVYWLAPEDGRPRAINTPGCQAYFPDVRTETGSVACVWP